MLRDRRVLLCLAVGLVGVVASRWSFVLVDDSPLAGGSFAEWLIRAVDLVPLLAALVAVVLTARPFVGVAVALPSQLLAAVILMVDFYGLAGAASFRSVVAMLLLALVLLPADVFTARARLRGSLDSRRGLVAGLLVGSAYVVFGVVVALVATDGYLAVLSEDYWLAAYLPPFLAFGATGWVAGLLVERLERRSPSPAYR